MHKMRRPYQRYPDYLAVGMVRGGGERNEKNGQGVMTRGVGNGSDQVGGKIDAAGSTATNQYSRNLAEDARRKHIFLYRWSDTDFRP